MSEHSLSQCFIVAAVTTGTAHWIAAARARESARPDRLFDDPFADALAGELGYRIMAASEQAGGNGENRFIPVRVKWFDDVISSAAAPQSQVVLLGAGLDTRPYRLDLPEDLDWFELDRAEIFAVKEPALTGAIPHCRRHTVSTDVTADWAPRLAAAGFDRTRPTIWVAEGLLFYLDHDSITALLRASAALSAPGSRFLADLFPASVVDRVTALGQGRRPSNIPPPFGFDNPVALFAEGDWRVTGATPPGAPEANYGRLTPIPSGMRLGHAHLVEAEPSVHTRQ
jgi:methyltransferase (TIGR00027 family)